MISSKVFDKVIPNEEQAFLMEELKQKVFSLICFIDLDLPDGEDKKHAIRLVRNAMMWANVCILKDDNGAPR